MRIKKRKNIRQNVQSRIEANRQRLEAAREDLPGCISLRITITSHPEQAAAQRANIK